MGIGLAEVGKCRNECQLADRREICIGGRIERMRRFGWVRSVWELSDFQTFHLFFCSYLAFLVGPARPASNFYLWEYM